MMNLWWLALPVLLLPVLWHRQKRERAATAPLATARFLPRASSLKRRVWRWQDRSLLLVRCLLLATVIAWLADLTLPWRGDAVLVVPGADPALVEREARAASLGDATRIVLPDGDAFSWLARHEREWRASARLLVVGPASMPASLPHFGHKVTVRSAPAPEARAERRVAIVSARADKWRAMFVALEAPQRYLLQDTADARTDLIVWDVPEAPPAGLRAPLWWIGMPAAFPELKDAPAIDGMRYADSTRGRLWSSPAWPPADADSARAQFEAWQRLHYGPAAWPAPAQDFAASAPAAIAAADGVLRYWMTIALLALFALERILAHARRR